MLTDQDIVNYQTQGAVVVRQLFSPAEIALLEQGIAENMAAPSSLAIVASLPEDPGYFIEDFCNWQRITAYKRFIFETGAAEVAGHLMQSNEVRLYHDHLLVKEPKTQAKTPWHQDQPYYNIDGFQNISMWLPVDPVAKESSLRLVAGSHREGWLMPRSFMNNEAKWFPEGTLKDLPDIDNNPDKYEILSWALEPGDAVFFHMLMLHAQAVLESATAAASSPSASWAKTQPTRHGNGAPPHPSPAWNNAYPQAQKCKAMNSRFCGRNPKFRPAPVQTPPAHPPPTQPQLHHLQSHPASTSTTAPDHPASTNRQTSAPTHRHCQSTPHQDGGHQPLSSEMLSSQLHAAPPASANKNLPGRSDTR